MNGSEHLDGAADDAMSGDEPLLELALESERALAPDDAYIDVSTHMLSGSNLIYSSMRQF